MRDGNFFVSFQNSLVLTATDPTYEGWKLDAKFHGILLLINLPILPMRDGNLSPVFRQTGRQSLPILPMRDGNPAPA